MKVDRRKLRPVIKSLNSLKRCLSQDIDSCLEELSKRDIDEDHMDNCTFILDADIKYLEFVCGMTDNWKIYATLNRKEIKKV